MYPWYKAIVCLYNVQDIEVTCSFLCHHHMQCFKYMAFKLALIQQENKICAVFVNPAILLEMYSQLEWTVVVCECSVWDVIISDDVKSLRRINF